ncbi:hypothetical protein PHMEG_00014505 [Phytophthora megakarya]|uniref:Uncharacterized protein n=1 Tax=Phytophthora megakarya TaxID=4795 RepID=A0A225W459_9STRA|nr:hypothetical protein PHMEG_00014505 [Phytophthora megakarya]
MSLGLADESNLNDVLQLCLASLVYDVQIFTATLSPNHPLLSTSIFTSSDVLNELHKNLEEGESLWMRPTLIPPHVELYKKIDQHQQSIDALPEMLEKRMECVLEDGEYDEYDDAKCSDSTSQVTEQTTGFRPPMNGDTLAANKVLGTTHEDMMKKVPVFVVSSQEDPQSNFGSVVKWIPRNYGQEVIGSSEVTGMPESEVTTVDPDRIRSDGLRSTDSEVIGSIWEDLFIGA